MAFIRTEDPKPGTLSEVLWLAGLSAWIIWAILGFWTMPHLVFVMLVAGSCMVVYRYRTKEDITAFSFAMVIGVLGELICTKYQLWIYQPEALKWGWSIPYWLFLVWGYLLTIFRRMGLTLHAWTGGDLTGAPGFVKSVLCWVFLFGVIYYYFYISVPHNVDPDYPTGPKIAHIHASIAAGFGLFLGAFLFKWHKQRDVLVFFAGAVVGPFGEYICIYRGIWIYPQPNTIPIPWLFNAEEVVKMPYSLNLAWGLVTLMAMRFGECWYKNKSQTSADV